MLMMFYSKLEVMKLEVPKVHIHMCVGSMNR
jgi:hypothetical protein